jgi:hypothetical protein
MLAKQKKPEISLHKLSFWCTAIVNDAKVRVRIRHAGGGKFQVIEADARMDLKIIDASDIIHCDV